MKIQDWMQIYEEMLKTFDRDKELTHITVCFNVAPVVGDKKEAIINVKTFKDDKRK